MVRSTLSTKAVFFSERSGATEGLQLERKPMLMQLKPERKTVFNRMDAVRICKCKKYTYQFHPFGPKAHNPLGFEKTLF